MELKINDEIITVSDSMNELREAALKNVQELLNDEYENGNIEKFEMEDLIDFINNYWDGEETDISTDTVNVKIEICDSEFEIDSGDDWLTDDYDDELLRVYWVANGIMSYIYVDDIEQAIQIITALSISQMNLDCIGYNSGGVEVFKDGDWEDYYNDNGESFDEAYEEDLQLMFEIMTGRKRI